MTHPMVHGSSFPSVQPEPHEPIWETKLPFEIAPGDGALIAKAMRAYRPDTSEEEGIVNFFIDQFERLDADKRERPSPCAHATMHRK